MVSHARSWRILAAISAGALVLTACGSDGDTTADSQTALLSDGSTILFVGHADLPDLGLSTSSAELYYTDLTIWL